MEEVTVTTPISPKCYGKGYNFLKNMGYQGHGSLIGNKKSLIEPLSHTEGHKTRDTLGLDFGIEDELPRFDRRAPMFSKSEDDEPSFCYHKC